MNAHDTTTAQGVQAPAATGARWPEERAGLPWFATARGLRRLLRAVEETPGGWQAHPQVPQLLAYIEAKYRLLARRYGREPADAVAAAFEVLAVPAILDAHDP
ncbi:hypothetical protein [Myceligenerans pegani]|uniref:Uncharacterized protein n=1 Tax=Myceligenerans pegani TaxID=2776917 RepID=A0ABR9N5P7_9MICO|nr:hypothetical protein [Myceligenerans sp. TRM 65318]MBE1878987.1 hypothetical protein [Myceligenerans sp. TRM 65318]MBE3021258.1 hypothetical protein [Myceligenerans sp. TRM 65318]